MHGAERSDLLQQFRKKRSKVDIAQIGGHGGNFKAVHAELFHIKPDRLDRRKILAEKRRLLTAHVQHVRNEHRLYGDGTRRHLFAQLVKEQAFVCGMLIDEIRLVAHFKNQISIEEVPFIFCTFQQELLLFRLLFRFRKEALVLGKNVLRRGRFTLLRSRLRCRRFLSPLGRYFRLRTGHGAVVKLQPASALP